MKAPRAAPFAWYAIAAALVVLYVNLFALWRVLATRLDDSAGHVPFATTLLLLAGLGVLAIHGARRRPDTKWLLVAGALVCAAIGLLATDPDYPSKRIHVPQYIVLALVVRRGLCLRLSGWPLTVLGWAITMVLGCHDELVQGFHPLRTFGLTDALTNGWGAAAGVLLAQGFGWMESGRSNDTPPPRPVVIATVCVLVALGLELVALDRFREAVLPYWAAMPLLGATLAWTCVDAISRYGDGWRHGLGVLVFFSALATAYPMISHVAPLVFG